MQIITVKDLIEQLKIFNPDAMVLLDSDLGLGEVSNVKLVSVETKKSKGKPIYNYWEFSETGKDAVIIS